VTVESAGLNRGSEFIVSFPALDDAEHGAPDNERDESRAVGTGLSRRILVVDDNVDAAESLADLLQLHGHEVRVVHSGGAALEAVGSFLPQIIFLDIAMPQMDGYEVARQLRQRPDLDHPVIVAVTGFGRDADRQRAREAGFDEHATKPLAPDVLARLVNSSRHE
jgi:CheY-like chemotaxis protein